MQTKAALLELFELLEDYAPVWYSEEHHNRAVQALGQFADPPLLIDESTRSIHSLPSSDAHRAESSRAAKGGTRRAALVARKG
jgi:hypothetical protein